MNTLLLSAIVLAAPALKDPPKRQLDLSGTWIVESQVNGGRPLNSKIERRYTFSADGKWMQTSGNTKVPAKLTRSYTLDAGRKPALIDMKLSAAANASTYTGIVKLEGDKLTLCYSRASEERPTTFESPEGTNVILIVLKRAPND